MLDKPVLLLESDTVPNAAVIVTFIAHFPGEVGGYFRGSLMLLPVFPRGGADIGLEYPGKVAGGGKPEIRSDGGQGFRDFIQ